MGPATARLPPLKPAPPHASLETLSMRTLLVCALLLLAPVAVLPTASAAQEPYCNSDYPTYQACEDAKDLVACLRGDVTRCPH